MTTIYCVLCVTYYAIYSILVRLAFIFARTGEKNGFLLPILSENIFYAYIILYFSNKCNTTCNLFLNLVYFLSERYMTFTLKDFLPDSIINLAEKLPAPLYVVGGFTRDFLAGFQVKNGDIDVCAPIHSDDFIAAAKKEGFKINSVYKTTGTVKFSDGKGNSYEFSPFRTDRYVRGNHSPAETFFTADIFLDAMRRDFTCNAVYYDIRATEYVDPLDGIEAIRQKRLTTVAPAEKVFGEDGLRLMRLARFSSQLGFNPDEDCLEGAKKHSALILDIHPERIWSELSAILTADEAHSIPYAQYTGLKVLDYTRVLDGILPELTKGRGMAQRSDFHNYDVLEHSLRCVKYCDGGLPLRTAALLHDVGKPDCFLRTGNFHGHAETGAAITEQIAARTPIPKAMAARVKKLVELHMYDLSMNTNENKLKRFFIENYDVLDDLMKIKQADYSACKDDLSPCPSNLRWQKMLKDMTENNAPKTLKELKINGDDVISLGYEKRYTAKILKGLLMRCAVNPRLNKKETLLRLSDGVFREIKNDERTRKKTTD